MTTAAAASSTAASEVPAPRMPMRRELEITLNEKDRQMAAKDQEIAWLRMQTRAGPMPAPPAQPQAAYEWT